MCPFISQIGYTIFETRNHCLLSVLHRNAMAAEGSGVLLYLQKYTHWGRCIFGGSRTTRYTHQDHSLFLDLQRVIAGQVTNYIGRRQSRVNKKLVRAQSQIPTSDKTCGAKFGPSTNDFLHTHKQDMAGRVPLLGPGTCLPHTHTHGHDCFHGISILWASGIPYQSAGVYVHQPPHARITWAPTCSAGRSSITPSNQSLVMLKFGSKAQEETRVSPHPRRKVLRTS